MDHIANKKAMKNQAQRLAMKLSIDTNSVKEKLREIR